MKAICLTQGKEALVSDVDYKYLMRWHWYYAKTINGGYAERKGPGPQYKTIRMHQAVALRKGLRSREVDHCNQNKLDNRRSNLRAATSGQNKANRGRPCNNTSGFKGVSRDSWTGLWRAQLMVHGQRHRSRRFHDKIEAAKAYNRLARRHFGQFAVLNNV